MLHVYLQHLVFISYYIILYAVYTIGNFGGKHSHRKDPKGIVSCLQRLERQPPCTDSTTTSSTGDRKKDRLGNHTRNLSSSNSINSGNSSSSSSRSLEDRPVLGSSVEEESDVHKRCRSASGTFKISLDLIGRVY